MSKFGNKMKSMIPKWCMQAISWLAVACVGSIVTQIIFGQGFTPVTTFLIVFVAIAAAVCFWLRQKPDQRDMKTVIADGRIAFGLSDASLHRGAVIDIPATKLGLEQLLNGGEFATSRIMGKQARIDLPAESAILQIAFLPIDKNGRTVVWKRLGKNHIFNKAHSVLISFSPYSSFFGQEFKEQGDGTDKRQLTLFDIYRREVCPSDPTCVPTFSPLGILWRPAEKGARAAYCFYLFVARYDTDFNSGEAVFKVFGSKRTRKYGFDCCQYFKKDHDAFLFSTNPAQEGDRRFLRKFEFELIDKHVLARYAEVLEGLGCDKE